MATKLSTVIRNMFLKSTNDLSWQEVQTANFNAVANCGYYIDTTAGPISALLPANPRSGSIISFIDYVGAFSAYPFTIDQNGNTIKGVSDNMVVISNRSSISLVYVNLADGWIASRSNMPLVHYEVNMLLVAGGGAGNFGGGGGAGGAFSQLNTVTSNNNYTIIIGAGGAVPYNGVDSTVTGPLISLTAIGGGAGATTDTSHGGGYNGTHNLYAGANGGSGGGSGGNATGDSNYLFPGGTGTVGQGFAGGGCPKNAFSPSGGGGGGGSIGGDGYGSWGGQTGGLGGTGLLSSITGIATYYAGGGGGACYSSGISPGGIGGGGTLYSAGTSNTGGGGGGGGEQGSYGGTGAGGTGGSGVVIIAYANPIQRGTGGTVTSYEAGITTHWVHTFTSSGTYTA